MYYYIIFASHPFLNKFLCSIYYLTFYVECIFLSRIINYGKSCFFDSQKHKHFFNLRLTYSILKLKISIEVRIQLNYMQKILLNQLKYKLISIEFFPNDTLSEFKLQLYIDKIFMIKIGNRIVILYYEHLTVLLNKIKVLN